MPSQPVAKYECPRIIYQIEYRRHGISSIFDDYKFRPISRQKGTFQQIRWKTLANAPRRCSCEFDSTSPVYNRASPHCFVYPVALIHSFCSHRSAVAFRDFRLYFFYYLRVSSAILRLTLRVSTTSLSRCLFSLGLRADDIARDLNKHQGSPKEKTEIETLNFAPLSPMQLS